MSNPYRLGGRVLEVDQLVNQHLEPAVPRELAALGRAAVWHLRVVLLGRGRGDLVCVVAVVRPGPAVLVAAVVVLVVAEAVNEEGRLSFMFQIL